MTLASEVLTDIVKDTVKGLLKGDNISKQEITRHQGRITELEKNLNRIESNRDYPSKAEFDQLKSAIDGLSDVYGMLSKRIGGLEGDVHSLRREFDEFKSSVSKDVTSLSKALQELENSYQAYQYNSVGNFSIHNMLGPDQYIENVDVYLNGQFMGKLLVNTFFPQSSLDIRIIEEGTTMYKVVAQAVFVNQFGQFYTDLAEGSGIIHVQAGSRFMLMITPLGVQLVQM